jgi:hypothetical protein
VTPGESAGQPKVRPFACFLKLLAVFARRLGAAWHESILNRRARRVPQPREERSAMAKTPSKSPVRNVAPASATQKPTTVPLPRGADPAGQANNAGAPRQAGSSEKTSRPDPAKVAQRAYERYQQRGGKDGGDQDDWYAAEKDLSGPGKSGGQK